MSTRSEKERTKQIHEKCQRMLNEMLKDDDNKYCVDCDAKGMLPSLAILNRTYSHVI